jgi:hypothetical protein
MIGSQEESFGFSSPGAGVFSGPAVIRISGVEAGGSVFNVILTSFETDTRLPPTVTTAGFNSNPWT